MKEDYCRICYLIVAPYDELVRLNGFVAHKRCLPRAVPRFCSGVGKMVVKLEKLNPTFGSFSPWLEEIRRTRRIREAKELALSLFGRLNSKKRKIQKVAKDLRNFIETNLFLEIPSDFCASPRTRAKSIGM